MEFVATPEFLERYERLSDPAAECVDDAIRRLTADPGSAWARQNRVVGEHGSAWLFPIRCGQEDCALYWRQPESHDDPIQLLLLLER
ncbi:MAG: hypothetical protein AAB198_06100 [Actinomycetota bacterium]